METTGKIIPVQLYYRYNYLLEMARPFSCTYRKYIVVQIALDAESANLCRSMIKI